MCQPTRDFRAHTMYPSLCVCFVMMPYMSVHTHPQVPGEKYDSEARIQDNQMDIVRLLVAHGADLNITDDSGTSPIAYIK